MEKGLGSGETDWHQQGSLVLESRGVRRRPNGSSEKSKSLGAALRRPGRDEDALAPERLRRQPADGSSSWYNENHQHSSTRFVSPAQGHDGSDIAILENRRLAFAVARARTPERWTRAVRNWRHIEVVELNSAPREEPENVVR
jgi:hypothetical protein